MSRLSSSAAVRRGGAARATIVAVLLASAACSDATAPLPTEGRPEVLEVSSGYYFGDNTRLVLRGDTVIYVRRPWGWEPGVPIDSVHTVPDAAAWRAFWAAVEESGVQRWRPRYVAEEIADGHGWGVEIEANGRRIVSVGSNAYPARDGSEHREMTSALRTLLNAAVALAGRPQHGGGGDGGA